MNSCRPAGRQYLHRMLHREVSAIRRFHLRRPGEYRLSITIISHSRVGGMQRGSYIQESLRPNLVPWTGVHQPTTAKGQRWARLAV